MLELSRAASSRDVCRPTCLQTRASKCRVVRSFVAVAGSLVLSACGSLDENITTSSEESFVVADGATAVNGWSARTDLVEAESPPHAGTLTLRTSLERAIAYSPAVRAAAIEIDARQSLEYQAGRRPNPDLNLSLENFGGNAEKSGFQETEETVAISQLIELGGKRVARLRAANLDTVAANWDFETARVIAATRTAQLFVDVLAAQERLKVLRKSVTLAERTKSAVVKRTRIGNLSTVEIDRAGVSVARAKAAVESERVRLGAASRHLATMWGSRHADFQSVAGRLDGPILVPPVDRVQAYLEQNPFVARWADEINRRHAMLDLEVSRSIPDVRLSGGWRRFEETGSSAMVGYVTVPLPVFDRNEGNIAAAERRIARAEQEARNARNSLDAQLVEALGALSVAEAQIRSLTREVLPAAESAAEKTQAGYSEGRFDLISTLDAQRTLIEVRLELVNAKAGFEKAKVQVEALIGRDLGSL